MHIVVINAGPVSAHPEWTNKLGRCEAWDWSEAVTDPRKCHRQSCQWCPSRSRMAQISPETTYFSFSTRHWPARKCFAANAVQQDARSPSGRQNHQKSGTSDVYSNVGSFLCSSTSLRIGKLLLPASHLRGTMGSCSTSTCAFLLRWWYFQISSQRQHIEQNRQSLQLNHQALPIGRTLDCLQKIA